MSYSNIDEDRARRFEEYNETREWLKEKATECDLYVYDQSEGCGRCQYESDMPKCKYADCKYLQNLLIQYH